MIYPDSLELYVGKTKPIVRQTLPTGRPTDRQTDGNIKVLDGGKMRNLTRMTKLLRYKTHICPSRRVNKVHMYFPLFRLFSRANRRLDLT